MDPVAPSLGIAPHPEQIDRSHGLDSPGIERSGKRLPAGKAWARAACHRGDAEPKIVMLERTPMVWIDEMRWQSVLCLVARVTGAIGVERLDRIQRACARRLGAAREAQLVHGQSVSLVDQFTAGNGCCILTYLPRAIGVMF